jgi:hypothetical protein
MAARANMHRCDIARKNRHGVSTLHQTVQKTQSQTVQIRA